MGLFLFFFEVYEKPQATSSSGEQNSSMQMSHNKFCDDHVCYRWHQVGKF